MSSQELLADGHLGGVKQRHSNASVIHKAAELQRDGGVDQGQHYNSATRFPGTKVLSARESYQGCV